MQRDPLLLERSGCSTAGTASPAAARTPLTGRCRTET
jgi:hypothetical protein